MLIELSEIKGKQVGALEEGALIGRVEKIIINPDDVQIIGLLVKVPGFLSRPKAVSFLDVVDIDSSAVVIRSASSLVEPGEIVRLDKLIKYKFEFIGLPVKNKNNKVIGRVNDAVVETAGGDILRIYVRNLFNDRVFERSLIKKVTLKEVIVNETADARRSKARANSELAEVKSTT